MAPTPLHRGGPSNHRPRPSTPPNLHARLTHQLLLLAQQQEGKIQEQKSTIQEQRDTIQEQEDFITAQDTALSNFIEVIKVLKSLPFDGREYLLQRFQERMDLQQSDDSRRRCIME